MPAIVDAMGQYPVAPANIKPAPIGRFTSIVCIQLSRVVATSCRSIVMSLGGDRFAQKRRRDLPRQIRVTAPQSARASQLFLAFRRIGQVSVATRRFVVLLRFAGSNHDISKLQYPQYIVTWRYVDESFSFFCRGLQGLTTGEPGFANRQECRRRRKVGLICDRDAPSVALTLAFVPTDK